MAEVITSIGSDTSTGTATPTSCGGSGGSGGYTVTFSSAPAGVARGDMVQMTDEATYYATFTYRVASISGSTFTFIFISEDSDFYGEQSPCDLMNMMWEQAECNFSRYYTTIYAWENDLGFTDVYDSGDDAVGECHNDSAFDESNTINGLGSLNSITLTVHADSRHNGLAGSGARIVRTGTTALTPIVINCNQVTVEWLEIDCTDATGVEAALKIDGSALEAINVRNMILHDVDPEDDVDDRYGIKVINSTAETVTRVVSNNFIYRILRSDASPGQERKCRGIGEISTEADDDAGASYYNNTIRTVSTTNGNSYGYHVSDESVLVNNIALSCGACYKVFDDTAGNLSSEYNLSSDLTAGDLGRQPPTYDNHAQTSATGVVANFTVVSLTNLHLRLGSQASGISWAVDRGTRLYGSDEFRTDIDGYIRVTGIPSAVARGYWDIGAHESIWSHPYPVSATADTYYMPPPLPAAFELAAVNPTVSIFAPSISITPAAAAFELAAVSPVVAIGYPSVSVTPSAASFALAAVSPSVVTPPVSVTPTAAAFELVGISPTVAIGYSSVSVTPGASSFELAAVTPSVVASSVTISTAVAEFELVADATVAPGDLAITPAAASFELVSVSPDVAISSVSVAPGASVFELAAVSPSISLGALSISPDASSFELVTVTPDVGLSALSVTPGASSFELVGISPSVSVGALSVTPDASSFELASVSPDVVLSSVSIASGASAFELAASSSGVATGSVVASPAAATMLMPASYGAVIAGSVTVIPVAAAQMNLDALTPSLGFSSMTVDVSASAVDVTAITPTTHQASINLAPSAAIVEVVATLATIHAGVEVRPAAAAFDYVTGPFTFHITMDSASLGYSIGGPADYAGWLPVEYAMANATDYVAGTWPTDYNTTQPTDYKYDHQS